jgi:hypothetical protein
MTVDTAYLQFAALLAAQPDVYLGNEGALFAAYGDNAARHTFTGNQLKSRNRLSDW